MSRSRRYKTYERESKKNLYLSLLGIVVVIFAVFKFGIPLIANFSLLVAGQGKNTEQSKNEFSFINAPILNPLPEATNSAEIVIKGRAEKGNKIELFINDSLVDKTSANSKGDFEFRNTLSEGSNKIAARVRKAEETSNFSQIFDVVFDSKAPELSIDSPTDGQSFSKEQNRANVAGKTESDSTITVNGFRAIVGFNGNFSYSLPLQNGENKITVIASDLAGNKTEKEIKVNYSP
jgi:bacillopeptidase F